MVVLRSSWVMLEVVLGPPREVGGGGGKVGGPRATSGEFQGSEAEMVVLEPRGGEADGSKVDLRGGEGEVGWSSGQKWRTSQNVDRFSLGTNKKKDKGLPPS